MGGERKRRLKKRPMSSLEEDGWAEAGAERANETTTYRPSTVEVARRWDGCGEWYDQTNSSWRFSFSAKVQRNVLGRCLTFTPLLFLAPGRGASGNNCRVGGGGKEEDYD